MPTKEDEAWLWSVRRSPLDILALGEQPWLRICAPMVRYSKLAFRELVRNYDVDVTYTPMILADVFKQSQICREMEFQTNTSRAENPVVVQFAASNAKDLADAAELVAPYCNGVDLNCGCPQKWAIHEHIGSYLMQQPELVKDMVSQVKRRTSPLVFQSESGRGFPCSVKIRIHSDIKQTIEFAQRAERAGADWITVHGRTRKQASSEPVDYDAIQLIKENVSIPVFANGDVFSLQDAQDIVAKTRVDGVMSARGLLENPALFSGYSTTPLECVKKFVDLSIGYGSNLFIFQHHLMFMLDKVMSRAEKRGFNVLPSVPAILDYLQEHYGIDYKASHVV